MPTVTAWGASGANLFAQLGLCVTMFCLACCFFFVNASWLPSSTSPSALCQGWGAYLLSRVAWIVEYRWWAAKINWILYLNSTFVFPRIIWRWNYVKERERLSFWLTVYVSAGHEVSSSSDVVFYLGCWKFWCGPYQMFTRAAFDPLALRSCALTFCGCRCQLSRRHYFT